MKLLNKTNIYYLLFAIPVFAACSGFLYYYISSEIISNLDESLLKEKIKTETKLVRGKSMYDMDDAVTLSQTNRLSNADIFSDTTLYDSLEEEMLPFRVLSSTVYDGKNRYNFTIRKSYIESDDLISSILYPVILLFVILLGGFFFINRYISKKLWSPFYKTIEQLQDFHLDTQKPVFPASKVSEFAVLNETLNQMTNKIFNDFSLQKQFIENASHEIQTPLAVIKSKIELLIQSKDIPAAEMQTIMSIYNASNKLSSLNKALLLLSKIENQQFQNMEEINFKTLLERNRGHLEELIDLKNIRVTIKGDDLLFKMNPTLADILIGNLFQNAIRHNIEGGLIDIVISGNSLVMTNTGTTTIQDTEKLFERFSKNEAAPDSIGLGLAIVKEICRENSISVSYTSRDKMHTLKLKFMEQNSNRA